MYEQRFVSRVVDYVDVFASQFAYYAVYSVAPYANACSYGVNAVVGAFYGNLCAFAGMRAARFIVISPSAISGTSASSSLIRKSGDVRLR